MTLLLPEFLIIHINSAYSVVNIYENSEYTKNNWPHFTKTEIKFTNIFKGTYNFEKFLIFIMRDRKPLKYVITAFMLATLLHHKISYH